MTREEKIKKIMEMSLEISLLANPSDDEIDNLYRETKKYLKMYKALLREDEEDE